MVTGIPDLLQSVKDGRTRNRYAPAIVLATLAEHGESDKADMELIVDNE